MKSKVNFKIKIMSATFISLLIIIFVLGNIGFFSVKSNEIIKADEVPITLNQWTTKANINDTRWYHNSVQLDGKIYAIGGVNINGYLSSVEVYDPVANVWTKIASLKEARIGATSVVLNGKIYIIGGVGTNGYLSSAEVYDPAANTWTTISNMQAVRAWHTSVVLNGKIYVIGGDNGYVCSSQVEVYDPATDVWTSTANMNGPRGWHNSIVLNGKIYTIGGYDRDVYLSSVEEYDPLEGTWKIVASMKNARGNFTSAEVKGKVYVMGGNSIQGCQASVEEYNPATNTWTVKASMKYDKVDHTSVVLNGKIYVIGGRSIDGALSLVEVYDPSENTWRTIPDMSYGREKHTASVINGAIYVVGGHNNISNKNVSSLEAYQINKIELNKNSVSLKVKEVDNIIATSLSEWIGVNWNSSNPEIVTVDDKGKITAQKEGVADITAKATDGSDMYAICKVNVIAPPETTISLNKTVVNLKVGQTDLLSATIIPSEVPITWTSKDKSIAVVDSNGNVTAIALGTTTIVATTEDGKVANCEVTIQPQNRAKVVINMSNNFIKNYDISKEELKKFLSWYEARTIGKDQVYYIFNNNKGDNLTVDKDYVPYDKIQFFSVEEY